MDLGNIQDLKAQSKGFLGRFIDEWGIVLVVVLVGLASFGLGRLSAQEGAKTPVSVTQASAAASASSGAQNKAISGDSEGLREGTGEVVASKNGTVYHLPWCSGAQRISVSNLVTFSSEAEAKAAGFRPAKNCKGLSE